MTRFQPFADWISKFSTFFLKNLFYFCQNPVVNTPEEISLLPPDLPSNIICPIYWIGKDNCSPCVSLLLDSDSLIIYQEILLYVMIYFKNNRGLYHEIFNFISHFVDSPFPFTITQFPSLLPKFTTYINSFIEKLVPKPQITEMKELEVFLDLNPPKLGYFAQTTKLTPSSSNLTNLNLESQTDVSSRNLLDSRQCYRCIKCNRLTNSLIERACPICGGNWKLQFFKS